MSDRANGDKYIATLLLEMSNEEIHDLRELKLHAIEKVAAYGAAIGAFDKRVQYSLEGHAGMVFRRREPPKSGPGSDGQW